MIGLNSLTDQFSVILEFSDEKRNVGLVCQNAKEKYDELYRNIDLNNLLQAWMVIDHNPKDMAMRRWQILKDNKIQLFLKNSMILGSIWNWFNSSSLGDVLTTMSSKLSDVKLKIYDSSDLCNLDRLNQLAKKRVKAYEDRHSWLYKKIALIFTGNNPCQAYLDLQKTITSVETKILDLSSETEKVFTENLRILDQESTKTLCCCSEGTSGQLWIDTKTGAIQSIWGHDASPLLYQGVKKGDLNYNNHSGWVTVGGCHGMSKQNNFKIQLNEGFELGTQAEIVVNLMQKEFDKRTAQATEKGYEITYKAHYPYVEWYHGLNSL